MFLIKSNVPTHRHSVSHCRWIALNTDRSRRKSHRILFLTSNIVGLVFGRSPGGICARTSNTLCKNVQIFSQSFSENSRVKE
jgi:hypothetical protein